MNGHFSAMEMEQFYKEYASKRNRTEVSSNKFLRDRICLPDSKTGKPRDHNYTATAANEFLRKVSETRLGEIVPGETKNLSYSLCLKRGPTPSLSPLNKNSR